MSYSSPLEEWIVESFKLFSLKDLDFFSIILIFSYTWSTFSHDFINYFSYSTHRIIQTFSFKIRSMLLEITEKSEVFVTSLVLFNKSNFFVNKP